jgi:hypothetical protein
MKPSLFLTVAGIYYLLDAIAETFQPDGFDFTPYAYVVFGLSFGVLLLLIRNEPASKTRDAIFMSGFISSMGIGLVAFYAQWRGTFMDSAVGYISPSLWFLIAAGFFIVGRANMSAK